MSALNVVCLISGGKDSLFSILHCLANGHEIVALANLHPPYDDIHSAVDDIDSYMYQTIGHSIIPIFEKALGLPLYRQAIIGTAVSHDKSYDPKTSNQDDETEALMPLLRQVMSHHPEVNAVSTGAILSDYQRTRVESVAVRLGLIPLSYLWQYPFLDPYSQATLLEDMAAVGQDSRIIKVASGGLDDSFLWQNVADSGTINRLAKASKRFGSDNDGAVLGEGGEYETLAVVGPPPLWKGQIVIHQEHRKVVLGEAGSASLKVLKADLKMYAGEAKKTQAVERPPVLEPRFEMILDNLQAHSMGAAEVTAQARDRVSKRDVRRANPSADAPGCSSYAAVHSLLPGVTGEGSDASAQMEFILDRALKHLARSGNGFGDVAYTSIILRDMADFPAINDVYGSYFTHPNPPARVTIACVDVLPPEKLLMVSFTFSNSMSPSRKALHVQSRSYWAPANIGPYSQAISIPIDGIMDLEAGALVYIAGQIPLTPASMELAYSTVAGEAHTFLFQSVLALQHAVRVGRATQVRQWVCAMAFIVADSPEAAIMRAKVVHQAWNDFHHSGISGLADCEDDEVEDAAFDVWNVTYGPARSHSYLRTGVLDQVKAKSTLLQESSPLYIVRVDALPKGASIEWVTYGSTTEASGPYIIPHFDHLLQLFQHHLVLPS